MQNIKFYLNEDEYEVLHRLSIDYHTTASQVAKGLVKMAIPSYKAMRIHIDSMYKDATSQIAQQLETYMANQVKDMRDLIGPMGKSKEGDNNG